jgi:aryl-alcohol dehydrogenase-like predicted oxidoreductase
MNYTLLGKTGVTVSRLCFGTMSFGGDADETTSAAMFRQCREAGINFFDCANVYSAGRAEEILGSLIAGCRDDIVLTTKVGFSSGEGPNEQGLSRRHIMLSVEKSLSD